MLENSYPKSIIFNAKSNPLPTLNKKGKILLLLNSLPIFNKFKYIKAMLCKELNIPLSSYLGKEFKCSSGNLKLGENVCLNDTFILDYAPVHIGNNVSFSFKNMIITSTHDLSDFNNVICKPIVIKDNVWITTGVIILGGVTIGANSVIGAGSVVNKDIPDGVFAAGNPCKVIRQIEFNK